MSQKIVLDLVTFGLPLIGLVLLSLMANHPLMWSVTGLWGVIFLVLMYLRWRSKNAATSSQSGSDSAKRS
jgi:hypothetical protein